MSKLSTAMVNRLMAGPVPRVAIATDLNTTESVTMTLKIHAQFMTPPHVVERHHGRGKETSYSLRPIAAGERGGEVVEVREPHP